MTIRAAEKEDIGSIIELFKMSLGDEGGIPSAEFWNWKHELNPFGSSPTLLAFEGNQLIGLRTFMSWKFRYKGRSIQAYRAVDTATHPDFRGKGIFSKLTLALIEVLKKEGPSVIFNTPNDQSRPGYLKMGWKAMGKTPLLVKPCPLNFVRNRILARTSFAETKWPDGVEEIWNRVAPRMEQLSQDVITTDFSFNYLKWRYHDIPGFQYHVHVTGSGADTCILVSRIKDGKLRELRITDIFNGQAKTRNVKKAIGEVSEIFKPDVITVLKDHHGNIPSLLPLGFMEASKFGLQVTYREVNSKELFELAANKELWYFNTGTSELF